MDKEFRDRRIKNPDYHILASITGIRLGGSGKVDWDVEIDGESDPLVAAEILEKAAKVLRQ